MLTSTLIFIASSFLLFTLSRLLLCAWQWHRVKEAGGVWPIIIGGLRIDATMIAMLAALPLLLSPWLGHQTFTQPYVAVWLMTGWILLVVLEASTPQFIIEYDTRPNRLYFEYFKYPKEVLGMLWKGYKLGVFGALCSIGALIWVGHSLFGHMVPDAPLAIWQRVVYTVVFA